MKTIYWILVLICGTASVLFTTLAVQCAYLSINATPFVQAQAMWGIIVYGFGTVPLGLLAYLCFLHTRG